jgi:RHS repeat-associated protein
MSTVDNASVVATIDLPVETGPDIANTFPIEAGDKINPAADDRAQRQEPAQLVYVLANASRAKNNGQTVVQLSLQVITPTEAINIALSLPTGLDYVDKSSSRAVYDAATRQLLWTGVLVDGKVTGVDSFTLNVNVPFVPASLPMAITWRTAKGDLAGQSVSVVPVGDNYISPVLSKSIGGKVRASDKIELDFPPGALKTDTAINVATYATFVTPGPNKRDIPVLPFSFGPDMAFDQPVTVTVNTAGLFSQDLISETGRQPSLQYVFTEVITPAKRDDGTLITTTVQKTEEMPSSYDARTGILTAQVMHFSDYQVSLQQPVNPQLWKLSANGGNVSLFRGALSYAYPIATPAMVGGLQPNLSLNYSSAAADSGFDQQYQPGENLSMGAGWSIAVPKITRAVKRSFVCPGGYPPPDYKCNGVWGYNGEYANDFTLSLGGKSYALIPKGGGEYVPEDYAPIKARLCNNITPCTGSLAVPGVSNVTGEWWQVWTPDGTRWVFGVDASTENVITMRQWDWANNVERNYDPNTNAWGGYAGQTVGYIARAWFLRRAYASVRDSVASGLWSVQWHYETGTNNITAPFSRLVGGQWLNPIELDPWARPLNILYGPSVRPNATAATQRWKVLFQYGWGPRLLNIVTSAADANGNTLALQRNYQLGTASGQPLDTVLEFGINVTGTWQAGMPATTFLYTNYAHNNNPANGNQRPLLTTIKNGYGAEWSYEYTGDQVLNSYWITKATTKNLISGQVQWTGVRTYVYSPNRCIANSASAGQCVNAAHVHFGAWPNDVVGFEWVKQRVVNPSNTATIYAETQHYFHYNTLHKLGRESQTRTFDYSSGSAVEVAAQTTDYYDWPDATGAHGLPAGSWFVAVKAVNVYPFGGVTSFPYQRTTYEYDNNTNFGQPNRALVGANVTRVVNHGFVCANPNCSGDEVTTKTGYYPNTSAWIVGKPGFENIYAGADETNEWPASADFRSQTLIYYDGQTGYDLAPTQGLVTRVGRGNSGNGAEWVTQQIGYDATGNISAITDARGNTTNAYYDSNGWFLTETRTPSLPGVGQLSTQYRYYGVNTTGCASGGFGMYGLLKCTIDPNSQATTYAYDHYGRLRKLIKPYDTYAHPTEEYFYYDAHSPFFTQRFVRKQSGVGVARAGHDSGWWQCAGAGCGVDLNALGTWERTFSDGLGRTIETQRPMADWANSGGQMAIAWASYDAFGRAWEQSVPYQAAYAGANYRAPNTGVARTSTTYDSQSRVKTVTGPDGAVTTHFYGLDNNATQGHTPTYAWAVHSVVDANSHAKQQVSDGLGRLRLVREFSGTNPWTVYAQTRYTYDGLGNLRFVVDAANNQTEMRYDALSRKNWMSDPDMGIWTYGYDGNGNLTSQTDARGQALWFSYDPLNRLTEKRTSATPGQQALSVWEYDQGANGLGRKTHTWTPGVNETKWVYDARGRVTDEQFVTPPLNAVPNWVTTHYAYDAADRVTSTTYPNNEIVTANYDAAGQPLSLGSNWGTTYVTAASYNTLGQLNRANFGNNLSVRRNHYGLEVAGNSSYGRLRQICVKVSDSIGCEDGSAGAGYPFNRAYAYDSVGNVVAMRDWAGPDQREHEFVYDHLDRLTNTYWDWSGAESYAYNAIGNLTYKSDVGNYTYDARPNDVPTERILPHAVHIAGDKSYAYDQNGNMTWRNENGTLWVQQWNEDNRLTNVYNYYNWAQSTQFAYDADGRMVRKTEQMSDKPYIVDGFENANGILWTQGINLTFGYNDGGNPVLRTIGAGCCPSRIDRKGGDIVSGRNVMVDFKVANADTGMHLTLQTSTGDYWRWSLNHIGNDLYNCYANPSGWAGCYLLVANLPLNTWYRAKLTIDDVNGAKAEVWRRDSGGNYASRVQAMPAGRVWFFFHTLVTGTDYLDNYAQNFVGGPQTTVYVGPHYEVNVTTGMGTNYYTFGGQRVAMRSYMGVLWLHGDQLGSASLMTDGGGNEVGQARYKPFGEKRSEWNAYFSDRKFTGQREEAGIGLYDYGARFYSPLLGRFISADSIVPGAGNPQALNRYSYVLNRPLSMIDPTGHYACEEACENDSFRTLDYQRRVYSSKFQRKSPESLGKFAELAGKKAFLLGAGIFNSSVWLQRAGTALSNFVAGSGTTSDIDVEDILLNSTTHRKVMLNQQAQVIQRANAAILGSGRSRRVSTFIASSGIGQGGQAGNWQYTLTDALQNPDIQAAYGGLDIATTARVSAVKNGNAWDVTLSITTLVEDPYDWEDYDGLPRRKWAGR